MPLLDPIDWHWRNWAQLSRDELHDTLRLRSCVFIVEQQDPYNDIDGYDPQGVHLLGYKNETLVAYGRLLMPGVKREEAVAGRICIDKAQRGRRIIYNLLLTMLRYLYEHAPAADVYGYTQTHWISGMLRNGAQPISAPMRKSRIDHVEIVLKNERLREIVEGQLVGKPLEALDEEIME